MFPSLCFVDVSSGIVPDDYKEELPKIRPNSIMVKKIADEFGFVKTENNMWLCTICAK